MPNYCELTVTAVGPEKQIRELVSTKFDFYKIIPMPKELANDTNDEICANCEEWMNLRNLTSDMKNYSLNGKDRMCSTCKIESNIGGRIGSDMSQLNRAEKKIAKSWIKKYGTASWYDWSIENWDTKWNRTDYAELSSITDTKNKDKLFTCYFIVPWGTPDKIFKKVTSKWTGIKLDVTSEIEGDRTYEYCYYGGRNEDINGEPLVFDIEGAVSKRGRLRTNERL